MKNTKLPWLLTFLLPRLQDIFFIGILMTGVLYGPRLFNLDGDLGRHITVGNYILENKTIPTKDIFSHTMNGERLVPHEWLAQVIFSAAHALLGLNGDVLLTAILIAATFTLTYREIIIRGTFRLVALFVGLWAAMASSLHWLARPHIFTFLFLAIWTYQLEHVVKKRSNYLWIFPLLMLIWANTHGAFIAGFVVWGAYAAEWLWGFLQKSADKENGRSLFLIGISSFVVTFITPSGYMLWATSLGYVGNKYLVDHTVEYMAPNFHLSGTWPFLLMLAAFLFLSSQGIKLKLRETILLSGWAVMALYSTRNIPLFAIVCTPLLGTLLQPFAEKLPFLVKQDGYLNRMETQLRGIMIPLIAILLLTFAFTRNLNLDAGKTGNYYESSVFPVNAVNWLEKNPQKGNVFNYFTWGGYLLYREWPKVTVFIDGQTDFYGAPLTQEYEQVISTSKGWETIFKKYNIEWVIMPNNSRLSRTLESEYQWRIIYEDTTSVILRK